MKRLVIVGAGGHGIVVADAADLSHEWEKISFVDDSYPEKKKVINWDVIGNTQMLPRLAKYFDAAIVAIGNAEIRMRILKGIEAAGMPLARVVHPRASVSRFATIGPGTVLMANTAVSAGAVVGRGCIINTGATVDHECELGDGTHIAPGAHLAADVQTGSNAWVGAGATIREQIRIGNDVVIGAGAAVVKDVPDGMVMVGVPARPIRSDAKLRVMESRSA